MKKDDTKNTNNKSESIKIFIFFAVIIVLCFACIAIFIVAKSISKERNKEEVTTEIEIETDTQEETEENETEVTEDFEENKEEPSVNEEEFQGEPVFGMENVEYESQTITYFDNALLEAETELPKSAIQTLPFQLDEFLLKSHPDYSDYPRFFNYIDNSYWEKDDNTMMFIRIQPEDYPDIYLDCGYYEDSEHWSFAEHDIEDLPSNHQRYKYANDNDDSSESASPVYDIGNEITVTDMN